jgi:hypothetical protein
MLPITRETLSPDLVDHHVAGNVAEIGIAQLCAVADRDRGDLPGAQPCHQTRNRGGGERQADAGHKQSLAKSHNGVIGRSAVSMNRAGSVTTTV